MSHASADDVCYSTERSTEKLVKKILGQNDIEAALLRLDRLTLDEAWATGVQTLEVVHGLVQNRRAVLVGKNTTLSLSLVRY